MTADISQRKILEHRDNQCHKVLKKKEVNLEFYTE